MRYLVGKRTCVINARLSGITGLTYRDGDLVADSYFEDFPRAIHGDIAEESP